MFNFFKSQGIETQREINDLEKDRFKNQLMNDLEDKCEYAKKLQQEVDSTLVAETLREKLRRFLAEENFVPPVGA